MNDDLATALGRSFIHRRDVKAIQFSDGHYEPERTNWKMSDLRAHINGSRTYGHYLVGTDGMVKLFAFDLDLTKQGYWFSLNEEDEVSLDPSPCNPREVWLSPDHPGRAWLTLQLRCTAEALALKIKRLFEEDIHVAISYSGSKGLHVYGLYPEPVLAASARASAIMCLKAFNGPDGRPGFEQVRGEHFWAPTGETPHNIEIEVFPKQDSLEGKDLGNLLRLPLGVNRKTGQQGYFLDCRCPYTQLRMMDPMAVLSGTLPWDAHE